MVNIASEPSWHLHRGRVSCFRQPAAARSAFRLAMDPKKVNAARPVDLDAILDAKIAALAEAHIAAMAAANAAKSDSATSEAANVGDKLSPTSEAAKTGTKMAPKSEAADGAAKSAATSAGSPRQPTLPAWPRLLSRKLAAAYVGLSIPAFEAEVKKGAWPAPQRHGRRVLYDRAQLDRALDVRAGLSAASPPSLGGLPWETS